MVGRLISLMVLGVPALGVAFLVVAGPAPVTGVLPPHVTGWFAGLVGPSGLIGKVQGGRNGERLADFLEKTAGRTLAGGPIAAAAGNVPVFISDILADHSTDVSAAIPAEITTIRPILGCRLTPPGEGTVIGHATAGQSDLPLPMITYDDTDLARAVQEFVDVYRTTGTAVPERSDELAYHAYDVVVTETAAPVYLVLETAGVNRLWNINLAPGARVERVVLLGGTQAGVANLDPVVPVEVILDSGLDACGIRPAYRADPGSAMRGAAGAGRPGTEAEAAAYDIWFHDSFGVKAGESRVGFDAGKVSLIGPVPGDGAPKAAYAPLDRSRIRLTQDSFFEIEGQVPAGQAFADRVSAITTSFAFGDLRNLQQGMEF